MAGLPTLQVLLDDGTGTFPYDITAKCRLAYDAKRGRQDELSTPTPGELKLLVDNTDGRFTPGSTIIASPSPIKADQKIRLKVTANAVTVNRFTGYVQQWPVAWPTGSQTLSEVQIMAVDAQARAERRTLLSMVEEEISQDDPASMYTLGEASGATYAADTSGNQEANLVPVGSGADVVFGTGTGPTTDGYTAATFAGGKYLAAVQTFASVPSAVAVGVFFAGTVQGIIGRIWPGTGPILSNVPTIGLSSGRIVVTDGVSVLQSPTGFDDGGVHDALIVFTPTGCTMYADGALIGTNASLLTLLDATMFLEVGGSGFAQTLGPLAGAPSFTGTMAHVRVFTSSLSAPRALAQATAGRTGFAGEPGTARITRLAGYANVPIGTLDTSLTNVAFDDTTGKTAGSCMQDVADAEMGTLYVNGSGSFDFHNRQEVTTKSAPDITIDANQLDPGTAFITDMQGVLNYIETTAQGTQVRQVARNATSETNHGQYPTSKTYLVQTDGEALDRANWVLNAHAEPSPRVGQLAIDMLTLTAAQQAALLAAEADTWIRIQNLPSQTPGGTTADLVFQGFQDVLSASGDSAAWVLTANVVSKATVFPSVWILGDATFGVLGSTTRLGV